MINTNCCEYIIKTPEDGQQLCPKHVAFFTKIKLRNNASCWLLLQEYIMMHGPLNVKKGLLVLTKQDRGWVDPRENMDFWERDEKFPARN
jgi:hypothetical protein